VNLGRAADGEAAAADVLVAAAAVVLAWVVEGACLVPALLAPVAACLARARPVRAAAHRALRPVSAVRVPRSDLQLLLVLAAVPASEVRGQEAAPALEVRGRVGILDSADRALEGALAAGAGLPTRT